MSGPFERHGLDHLSASSINLFVAQPSMTPAMAAQFAALARGSIPVRAVLVCAAAADRVFPADVKTVVDENGLAARRYDAQAGTCYLIRPDQHVAARWRALDVARIEAAVARATCKV